MCRALYLKSSTLRVYEQQKKGTEKISECQEYLRQLRIVGEQDKELSWMTKPLWKSVPGMYHQRIEEGAGIKKYYQWIEKDGLEESSDHSSITTRSYQSLTSRQTSSC